MRLVRQFRAHGTSAIVAAGVVALMIVIALLPRPPGGWDPSGCALDRSLRPPAVPAHVFGFDVQGCDLFTLTLAGTRLSLIVGLMAAGLSAVVAIPAGSAAGFLGGWVESTVGRLVDLLTGLPIVLVGLVVLTAVEERGVTLVAIVLAVAAFPIHTRVIQVATARTVSEPYVDAARALGASRRRILLRHVLPASLEALVPVIPTTIAFSIGIEAVLSFLGAGLQLPDVSWGVLLAESDRWSRQAPHLLFPAVFLVALTASLVVLAEAWRQRDPAGERLAAQRATSESRAVPMSRTPVSEQVTVLDPEGIRRDG